MRRRVSYAIVWDGETMITYTKHGDYYLPNLALPEQPEYEIGWFGIMRRNYLKNHQKILFTNLLTSGKLNAHLAEIDQTANDRFWLITKQMAEAEGITEELKACDQMLWVQKMNNIRNRTEEIIREELIYT